MYLMLLESLLHRYRLQKMEIEQRALEVKQLQRDTMLSIYRVCGPF